MFAKYIVNLIVLDVKVNKTYISSSTSLIFLFISYSKAQKDVVSSVVKNTDYTIDIH